jgi:hypothetical protein
MTRWARHMPRLYTPCYFSDWDRPSAERKSKRATNAVLSTFKRLWVFGNALTLFAFQIHNQQLGIPEFNKYPSKFNRRWGTG